MPGGHDRCFQSGLQVALLTYILFDCNVGLSFYIVYIDTKRRRVQNIYVLVIGMLSEKSIPS